MTPAPRSGGRSASRSAIPSRRSCSRAVTAALENPAAPPVEVAGDGRTFRLSPVNVPEFEFTNLYGTDVTAEKAIDKFPNENPNPVLRLTRDGTLTYANPASALVRRALGTEVGGRLEPEMLARILGALADGPAGVTELEAEGRTFAVRVVRVYEFDSINLYGTDITAARQVEAFSRENERLLLNILPASIAERLRGGERVIADRFDDMAVLFADVVGFTALSATMAARRGRPAPQRRLHARATSSPTGSGWRRSRPSATRTWSSAACRAAPTTRRRRAPPRMSRTWASRSSTSSRASSTPPGPGSRCGSGSTSAPPSPA